jgi:hypothetical protein
VSGFSGASAGVRCLASAINAFYTGQIELARAYHEENVHREQDCYSERALHEILMVGHAFNLRWDRAREAFGKVPRCDLPLSSIMLWSLVDIELAAAGRGTGGTQKEVRAARSVAKAPGEALMLDVIDGRYEVYARNATTGRARLRDAIERASHLSPDDTSARKARTAAYGTLIADAAAHGEWNEALTIFAEESSLDPPPTCVLAVAIDDERSVAIAVDHMGNTIGELSLRASQRELEVEALVSDDLEHAVSPCPSIAVIARPPIHGRGGLLSPELAWSYRGIAHRPGLEQRAKSRLVVADPEPPATFGLPPLRRRPVSAADDAATVVLRGVHATPEAVLRDMRNAGEVEIHAHGLVNLAIADTSFIVLSEGISKKAVLTASDVRSAELLGNPLVFLAACHAAKTAPYIHESWSLPAAFLRAGAGAVIASPAPIGDAVAYDVIDSIRARIRRGVVPSIAVRDERISHRDTEDWEWIKEMLVFD